MNRSPFLFRDFVRARDNLFEALVEQEEPYVLLTGDTGTGKTALMSQLKRQLDRARYRVLYFPSAKKLGAAGLIKVTAEALRARTGLCHSVSFDRLFQALTEDTRSILLWIDEAQNLPNETFAELRALAEIDLENTHRVQVLLSGLPRLRSVVQALPFLWRRFSVREEITGLVLEEMPSFLEHHFGPEEGKRLCEQGLSILFERAAAAPGLLLPMYRAILRYAGKGSKKIEAEDVDEALARWELA